MLTLSTFWAVPEKNQTGWVEDMEYPGVFVFTS